MPAFNTGVALALVPLASAFTPVALSVRLAGRIAKLSDEQPVTLPEVNSTRTLRAALNGTNVAVPRPAATVIVTGFDKSGVEQPVAEPVTSLAVILAEEPVLMTPLLSASRLSD